MLKFIIAGLILIHSLIHLLGFVKAFRLARIDMLTLSISKPAGLLWLLAAVSCMVTAVAFISGKEWWWMIALPALILSQLLIILYWQDAKFGTSANLIILIFTILAFGSWNFNGLVKNEVKSLMAAAAAATPAEKKIITGEMLSNLPPVVKLWLQRSNVIGREMIHSVYLKQTGEMRSSPGGKWMPLTAEQWFTAEKPGFIWVGRVTAAAGIKITARDKYEQGRGQMLIKLLSLYTIADVTGKETDQSTMLRYLAEIFWFPSASLSNYLQWKEVDSLTARAIIQLWRNQRLGPDQVQYQWRHGQFRNPAILRS